MAQTTSQLAETKRLFGTENPTQAQLNQALVAELQARPGTSQADMTAYATQQYGLTPDQVATAYQSMQRNTGPTDQTQAANTATPTGATEGTLSNWAAPYVTDMLSDAWALAERPYQEYKGPLTAGASDLQSQAFQGLAGLTVPTGVSGAADAATDIAGRYQNLSYVPTQFTTGTFGSLEAQQYMNPYLQTALNPQMEEARRQAKISRMGDAARLSKAGAFGGSRQAIMESELGRNLMTKQNEMLTQGYNTAYDKAMAQFNADQARALDVQRATEGSRQFGANYGLSALEGELGATKAGSALGLAGLGAERDILGQQLTAGGIQRGITSEGIAADKAQFEEERAWPYQALQFQQSMLQGLPVSTTRTYGAGTDALTNALTSAAGLGGLAQSITGAKK